MHRLRLVPLALGLLVAADLAAQQPLGPPLSPGALRTRLEAYAADSMRGRMTGSPEHVQATRYIADELRAMGLRPAGDSGTFLQRVPLVRSALDTAASRITAAGRVLRPYVDYIPRDQGPAARPFDGVPVIFAGVWGASDLLGGDAVRGKTVVLATPVANPSVIKLDAQARFAQAAAIVIANFDLMAPSLIAAISATPIGFAAEDPSALPAYMHTSRATAAAILGVTSLELAVTGQSGSPINGRIAFRKVPVETYNVVAVLPGTDDGLRHEYVAIGSHSDHVGTGPAADRDSTRAFNLELRRKQLENNGLITQAIYESIRVNMDSIRKLHPTPRLDSIFNGADDDGSGSMATLEIARAFATAPVKPKRSLVFVWHAAEELGLFGSQHFTDHPTVPREEIVAQINLDMIGRGRAGDEKSGGPDYLQLIGSRRLSTELGDLVEKVSRDKRFNWVFDYQYDANGHPEQYYCRSDHYMYARYGIPVVFMSTGGHADYHEMTDEVEFIDFEKLSKVSRFVHELATALANNPTRPDVDKPKPDPNGQCVQ
jgi:hypothetical protein